MVYFSVATADLAVFDYQKTAIHQIWYIPTFTQFLSSHAQIRKRSWSFASGIIYLLLNKELQELIIEK